MTCVVHGPVAVTEVKERSVSSTGTLYSTLTIGNVWDVVEKMDVVEQVNNGQHRSKYTQYKQKQTKSADIPFL